MNRYYVMHPQGLPREISHDEAEEVDADVMVCDTPEEALAMFTFLAMPTAGGIQ